MSNPADPQPSLSFMSISERRWALWSSVATALSLSLAIMTGIWAVFEYRENQEDERVKQTLRLVENWEEGDYREAYVHLNDAYLAFVDLVPAPDRKSAETDAGIRERIRGKFNRQVALDPIRREEIRRVLYFFNKLNLCVKADLCSQRAASVFFDDTVRTFLDVFQDYVAHGGDAVPGGSGALGELSERLNATQ